MAVRSFQVYTLSETTCFLLDIGITGMSKMSSDSATVCTFQLHSGSVCVCINYDFPLFNALRLLLQRQSSSAGGGPVISMMDRGGVGAQMNPMASIGSHGMPGLMQQPPMYQPPAALYDDDPGIMSEVETSATGLRRGAKARSSLPIVRTPNKTNERPLGKTRCICSKITHRHVSTPVG